MGLRNIILAQVYQGGGVGAGVGAAGGIAGIATGTNPRQVIGNVVNTALNFAALLAVTVIVIAGFILILSLGNEARKDTAKKTILYTAIGILVILLAKILVYFVMELIL